MRQHRSRFGALASAAWLATWLLGVALACSDDPNCGQDNDCVPFQDALEDSLNDGEVPCSSLSESACQRSGRCIVDSICVPRSCSGPGCSKTCDLVPTCVPY